MASSNDFEKIWESYQEVVKTKDISIVDYCQRNGIVYSQFQRWYKKHVSGVNIVPVSDPDFQTESSLMISEESNPSPHLRQICDWCRLIWTYRDNLDLRLLEKRLTSAGLMPKWKAFAALAVAYLGMNPQIMPFYSVEAKWKRKADNILPLILETGNFGHARDMSYKGKVGLAERLYISLKRHTHDGYVRARVFPQDAVRVWFCEMGKAVKEVVKGKI